MAFGPRTSYFRLRNLDTGVVIANISESKHLGFGSAFMDHDHKKVWAFGCNRGASGNWPLEDQVGLFAYLKRHGSRLGGMTGPYALRRLGYDNLILSKSVVAALNMAGVIDGAATSKKAQAAVQAAFNEWVAQSSETYARVSLTLAMSVPD